MSKKSKYYSSDHKRFSKTVNYPLNIDLETCFAYGTFKGCKVKDLILLSATSRKYIKNYVKIDRAKPDVLKALALTNDDDVMYYLRNEKRK